MAHLNQDNDDYQTFWDNFGKYLKVNKHSARV